jgi:1-deoxyxylulose-5-phosphate synthase
VILGCGTFGGIGGARHLIGKGLDADISRAVLDEAVSLGITMLDTAERYADGLSERMIGQWLAAQPAAVTDAVRITTKVAPPDGSGPHALFDVAFIEPLFAGSLHRLGVERVDWLLTHAQDGATPIEATLEALEAIRCSGRCDHVGGCNLDASQLRAAITAAERLGDPRL